MKKITFDQHVANLYEELKLIVETRYRERGQDALHDALEAIYRRKAYKGLKEALDLKSMTGWMVQSVIFAMRSKYRDESKYRKRYTLICELEERKSQGLRKAGRVEYTHGGHEAEAWEGTVEYPSDIIRDVQLAIGTLSAYHQNLVHAYFYEEHTVREIAKKTGETFYRVFTELEIAKACLRSQLEIYRK